MRDPKESPQIQSPVDDASKYSSGGESKGVLTYVESKYISAIERFIDPYVEIMACHCQQPLDFIEPFYSTRKKEVVPVDKGESYPRDCRDDVVFDNRNFDHDMQRRTKEHDVDVLKRSSSAHPSTTTTNLFSKRSSSSGNRAKIKRSASAIPTSEFERKRTEFGDNSLLVIKEDYYIEEEKSDYPSYEDSPDLMFVGGNSIDQMSVHSKKSLQEFYVGSSNKLRQKHGFGTCMYNRGDKYVGKFKNDMRCGKGTYYYHNGNTYLGEWKDNRRNGKGTFTYSNGDVFEGHFKDGKADGFGKMTRFDLHGDIIVTKGKWKNGNIVNLH